MNSFSSPSARSVPPPFEEATTQSPISMDFEALTELMGRGIGRSRAIWDCYQMGIDPIWFYDPNVPDQQLDASVHNSLKTLVEDHCYSETTTAWSRTELKQRISQRRRDQGLGKLSLETLKGFGRGAIEDTIATISHISVASDGTTKLLVKLIQDGLEVEAVIIPWKERGRSTLCISSQVGCAQGCSFCATGRMGRLRNLSADEICAQVFLARKICRVLDILRIDGIVFMGMGEPA